MEIVIASNEIWLPVPGYGDNYLISNLGRVKTLARGAEKILSPGILPAGYHLVVLGPKTDRKTRLVHRLVAAAFVPNPENKRTVNHIDGNKANNHFSNLEWASYLENNLHARTTGLNRSYSDRAKPKGNYHPKSKQVDQYTLDGVFLRRWDSLGAIKRELGYSPDNISRTCRGQKKTAYEFRWKYYQPEIQIF
jgi:hypothetical protein